MQSCASTSRFLKLLILLSMLSFARAATAEDPAKRGITKGEDSAQRRGEFTTKVDALPIFEKPSRSASADLSDQIKELSASVCLIGSSRNGTGTGFVLSKKHRLIATNAHCADIRYPFGELYVMTNDSDKVYEVDKVWYHPGLNRIHKTGIIRSSDPAQGKAYVVGPDVAVVHVGGDAELPDEIPLATASEIKNIFGKPVAMIGYPGHDTGGWPSPGERPAATAREGIIARLTDFQSNGAADEADRQYLQHTMANWYGFSGSPMFLANGHVIALNNSGRTVRANIDTSLAFGIRVDCLWELLAYHKLTDKVSIPVDQKELRLGRFEKEDPRLTQLNQVIDLVAKADELLGKEKYSKAVPLLKKAIRILPNYADAHAKLGQTHSNFAIHVIWKEISDGSDKYKMSDYRAELEKGLAEYETALKIEPTNVDYVLDVGRIKSAVHFATDDGNAPDFEEMKVLARKLINENSISMEQRAYAWQLLGTAHAKSEDRIPLYKIALELQPHSITFAGDIARAYRSINEDKLAEEFEGKLARLTAAQKNEAKMWEMATSPDANKRNGAEALRLASDACEASNYMYWSYLECLAAAYAETKKFDEAQIFQSKAFLFVPEIYRSGAKKRLKLYLDNKPFREAE